MSSKIKMINNRGSLSETDLTLLKGTSLLIDMMRNRKVVKVGESYEPDWAQMTVGVEGLYHIRRMDPHKIYQVWFELKSDLDVFERNLFTQKLSA